jgi:integrative and conjugative element protein (TIGR02256 family)
MNIFYHASVLEVFEAEIAQFGVVETGGVLLGWYEEEKVVVFKATSAGPNSTHENFYFQADSNYIDMIIDMEYANSNGKINYVGEWHTHPQLTPQPSSVDLNSLDEIVESSGKPNLLLIIGAIDFKKERFPDQSISIVKLPNDSRYFELNPVLGD